MLHFQGRFVGEDNLRSRHQLHQPRRQGRQLPSHLMEQVSKRAARNGNAQAGELLGQPIQWQ